jgi:peroxiredoxin
MYPHERSLVKQLEKEPFALVGINSDSSPEDLAKVIEKENITWPSFFDGGSTRGPIATMWGVYAWPTIYVLDHEGIIRYQDVRGEQLEQAVEQLLEELKGKSEEERGDNTIQPK